LRDLYDFYGPEAGVRIARKHIGWYCRERPQELAFRQSVMQVESAEGQLARVREFFDASGREHAAAA
jgi:tRNA-dihydrouridine synthase B